MCIISFSMCFLLYLHKHLYKTTAKKRRKLEKKNLPVKLVYLQHCTHRLFTHPCTHAGPWVYVTVSIWMWNFTFEMHTSSNKERIVAVQHRGSLCPQSVQWWNVCGKYVYRKWGQCWDTCTVLGYFPFLLLYFHFTTFRRQILYLYILLMTSVTKLFADYILQEKSEK